MNCTSCKKPVAVGASKCAACGAAVSSDYSYDLLPEEPASKKAEEGPSFALPPGIQLPEGPPPGGASEPGEKPARVLRADRARGANAVAGGGKASYFKLGVGAAVVLIFVVLGMRLCGGPSVKITGATKLSQSFNTSNLLTVARPFEIFGGKAEYSFTVEPKTGDVIIGVVRRNQRDKITPDLIKSWNLTPVPKGESKTLTGELDSGTYSFVISTESKAIVQGALKAEVK